MPSKAVGRLLRAQGVAAPSSALRPKPAMSCHQVMRSLAECQKRFKSEQDIFCRHLHEKAGWCIFQNLCPREVSNLEDCLGTTNIRTRSSEIPARCKEREAQLSACIEGQQLAAEARTAACPSKRKQQAPTNEPAAPVQRS